MILISLELDKASRKELARLELDTPRTFRAASAAAATRAQNQLRKILREAGGSYGVPRFAAHHEMSRRLRPSGKMFGKLADKGNIVKFRRNGAQVIGWPDKLANWASSVQGASRHPFEDRQRRMFHAYYRELDGYKIPEYYDRPERLVIDPFAAHLQTAFPGMVLEQYEKAVARRQKKGLAVL